MLKKILKRGVAFCFLLDIRELAHFFESAGLLSWTVSKPWANSQIYLNSDAVSGWAGRALAHLEAHLEFGSHQITACPPGFENLRASLLYTIIKKTKSIATDKNEFVNKQQSDEKWLLKFFWIFHNLSEVVLPLPETKEIAIALCFLVLDLWNHADNSKSFKSYHNCWF